MYLLWVMLAYLALCIIRIIKGTSIWDKLLGLNIIYTKVIIIIVIFASFHGKAYYLDFAIVCILLAFISTFFTTRFLLGREKGGN